MNLCPGHLAKSEIRNSKSETSPKFETRKRLALSSFSSFVLRAPHPQPLSPRGRGEGWRGSDFVFYFVAIALLAGCGEKTSVRGTVKWNGERLPDGYITFVPADAAGSSSGTDIVDGAYSLEEITPGQKRALVTTRPTVLVTKYAPGEKPKLKVFATENIPPDAPGNNQLVDIKPGTQLIDIEIRKP